MEHTSHEAAHTHSHIHAHNASNNYTWKRRHIHCFSVPVFGWATASTIQHTVSSNPPEQGTRTHTLTRASFVANSSPFMNGLLVIRVFRNSVYGCEQRTEYGHTLTVAKIGFFFTLHLSSFNKQKILGEVQRTREFRKFKVLSIVDVGFLFGIETV